MKVEIDGNVAVHVSWVYGINKADACWRMFPPQREVLCVIHNGGVKPDREYISEGWARCQPPDIFCKNTGRKISLTTALRNSSFSKSDRRKFWEAYNDFTKGKLRLIAKSGKTQRHLLAMLKEMLHFDLKCVTGISEETYEKARKLIAQIEGNGHEAAAKDS